MGKIIVNDIHAQINETEISKIFEVKSVSNIQNVVKLALKEKKAISIAGSRHSMGGQQFGKDTYLIDIKKMNRILGFDKKKGLIEVEAGVEWPDLINYLITSQENNNKQWTINQKQTGADNLTIGGSIGTNIHGRGLKMKPFVQDIELFYLINPRGEILECSRKKNKELFSLVLGGYGLFGVVTSAVLRLSTRRKMERVVEVIQIKDLKTYFDKRIKQGFLYGDFQFAINEKNDNFLTTGIFSCYKPAKKSAVVPPFQKELNIEDWKKLLYLAHTDKDKAFEIYRQHYLKTSGQVYWSDLMQLSKYIENYHSMIDKLEHAHENATEIITEIYVQPNKIADFMKTAAKYLSSHNVNIIYGTVRKIVKDDETFLPWAKDNYLCIIFNIHTAHTPEGMNNSAEAFRKLIDLGIQFGGSYFLTYHTFARKDQILTCYPQFPDFLRLKRKYDPNEVFQSNWYRHYKEMFSDIL